MNNDKKASSTSEKKNVQKAIKPWDGKAKPADKAILILAGLFMVYNIGLRIYTPFLIAEHSLLLTFLSGSSASIGAAAAFAKVESTPLLAPIVLGTLGGMKFLWLFWWAGRRWGNKIIEVVSPSPKIAQRFLKLKEKKGLGAILLLVSDLPGVPSMLIILLVGWQKMKLWVFLLLSFVASSVWVIVVALAGYQSGQIGVDIVMAVDKYALWVSIAIIFVIAFWSAHKAQKETAEEQDEIEEIVEKEETDKKDS